ncbi:hypothetical protein F5Y16DRAFT_396440 [Xylariaceae sp. FL0255]|nr:hypothetical protein F5Y16DRAFT_396440 [Xylariaceae sp. FL0255]
MADKKNDAEDGTDYEWDLDDAQEEMTETSGENCKKILEHALLLRPKAPVSRQRHPVILPQRRPKWRQRGFIRAYAPDLQACGIDQATFMSFLDELDKSTVWSPLADIINLLTLLTFAIAGRYGAAISLPIQIATGIYKEVQGRYGLEGAADGYGPKKSGFYRGLEKYRAHRDRKRTSKWIRINPDTPLEAMMDFAAAERAREKGLKKPKKRRLARVCLTSLHFPLRIASNPPKPATNHCAMFSNLLYMMIVNMPSEEEMATALSIEREAGI